MFRTLLWVTVLVSATVLAAPKGKGAKKPPPPPPPVPTEPMPKVSENLGDKVTAMLAGASKVQTFRVADSGGLRPDPTKAIGSDFVRENAGKELSADELKAFRGLLYDEKSYRFESDVSKCNFTPNLSFQAQSGIDTLEALISFKCNQVFFFIGKPGGRWLPGGAFDIKPVRTKLLDLAKATMPQDAATQNLK